MKHDASKTLGGQTKKRRDTPRALQVGYRKHKEQLLSEMRHTHRDFFGFVPPPSFGSTQASTEKKCYNYVERGHFTHQCPLVPNCLGDSTLAESSQMMLEDELTV
jgi:hypothetical protein